MRAIGFHPIFRTPNGASKSRSQESGRPIPNTLRPGTPIKDGTLCSPPLPLFGSFRALGSGTILAGPQPEPRAFSIRRNRDERHENTFIAPTLDAKLRSRRIWSASRPNRLTLRLSTRAQERIRVPTHPALSITPHRE